MMRTARIALTAVATATALLASSAASISQAQPIAQPGVVSAVPRANTPNVLDGEVHAIVQVGDTVFVGGKFTQVRANNNQTVLVRTNFFSYSFSTGVIDATFAPNPDGSVEAMVAAADGTVYAGGSFKNWAGVIRTRLVKFAAATGIVDTKFKGKPGSIVRDLNLSGGKLYLSGDFKTVSGVARQLLAAVSPTTGAVDPLVSFTFTTARATPSITRFDISPDGLTLVAVGNFNTVNGASRPWAAKFNLLASAPAELTNWYTDAFNCYWWGPVQHDIDFSPDGSYFAIVNTGGNDDEYYACDAASRWETSASGFARPTWINYTGSDSLWSVAVTGAAVYVGGHQRQMNNPFWNHQFGLGGVDRAGLGALDPGNGIPFSWNPGRDRGQGVYVLYTTADGLYEGSDTDILAGQFHARIGFFPLVGGVTVPAWSGGHLPGPFFRNTATATLIARSYDGSTVGANSTVSGPGVDSEVWSQSRCATMISGQLITATTAGTLTKRTYDGTTFGPASTVNLNGLENGGYGQHAAMSTVFANCTSLFYDSGRLFYVSGGDGKLYSRAFNPESGILDAVERTDDDSSHGTTYAQTTLSYTVVDGNLYEASAATGRLYKRSWSASNPTAGGVPVAISGPDVDGNTWTGGNVFFALSN